MPLEHPGGGVVREHTAVRTAVGVFDVSHLGKLAVRGPGARALVDAVLTNDTAKIVPGRSQYTLCCEEATGGVVDDLIAYLRADDDLLLVPNAANAAAVASTLTAGLRLGLVDAAGDTAVTDVHTDLAVLAVQGPRADELMDAVGLPAGIEHTSFLDATWRGLPVVVCRTGYTGERGYELLPRWSDAAELWDALLTAAAPLGGLPCGLAARDTLRTEMGYPLHGHELGPDVTPLQARLGWAVGWAKPSFAGREVLLAERERGPVRRLWGLLADGRGVPRAGMDVRDPSSGALLGRTTSGTFSPTLGRGIALALLDATVEAQAPVTVDVRGRPLPARVVRPPFVPDHVRG
jgi:aminomethyltransferase